ncbi:RHS repeat-associated core domain protein [compost metagenome]
MHKWMKLIGLSLLSFSSLAHSAEVFVTYYHNDLLGSPVAATDEWGNILWREHYRPYGERQETPEYRGYGSIGFTGHVQNQTSGLVYAGSRYYDPVLGRFLSVDPKGVNIIEPLTFNRFAYAYDNSYRNVDPDGREVISLDARNNLYLAGLINSRASVVFRFDVNNKLRIVEGSGGSGSNYYSSRLIQAIASDKRISLGVGSYYFAPNGIKYDVDEQAGGGLTYSGFKDGSNVVFISGNANPSLKDENGFSLRDDPADILVHELVGHAVPRIIGGDTGNAVENENKVRAQVVGGGHRMAEPLHFEKVGR